MSSFNAEREAEAKAAALGRLFEMTVMGWSGMEDEMLKVELRSLAARCHDAAVEACGADKKRLDEMQFMTTGYGEGWMLRLSEFSRGWRLHETSRHGGEPDIRDAIDNAIHERRRRREQG